MQHARFGLLILLTSVSAGMAVLGDPATNVATGTNAAPLPPAPTARIAQYLGDRAAAISYTFDDGTHDQLQVVPLLNAHGFHGTFLIIASRVPDTEAQVAAQHMVSWGSISWEKLRELQAEGHEMSSHSWSHSNMRTLSDADLRAEVEKADQLMAEKLGKPPLTFCYPGNGFDDKIRAVVLEHHVNDRTDCTGLSGPTFTQDAANEWVDGLIHDHGWGVTMIHNVNNTDPNATNLNVLSGQMDYVKSRSDSVWVDTFLNVSLYTKEQAAAKVAVTSTGDHKADVLLTCSLDPTLYHFPLTVVVALPGVTQASAGQGISSIPVIVGKDSVQFDVVPGPAATALTWAGGK
jgi:peptidoglycan/xylan/chitin deacetylase (PgdA/CDA1 family)